MMLLHRFDKAIIGDVKRSSILQWRQDLLLTLEYRSGCDMQYYQLYNRL